MYVTPERRSVRRRRSHHTSREGTPERNAPSTRRGCMAFGGGSGSGDGGIDGTCSSEATNWLTAGRKPVDAASARACLSLGSGDWTARALEANSTIPYLLDHSTRLGRRERKWWGRCDVDDEGQPRNAARSALNFEWRPQGAGCAQLRKGRLSLPTLGVLACAFCMRCQDRTQAASPRSLY